LVIGKLSFDIAIHEAISVNSQKQKTPPSNWGRFFVVFYFKIVANNIIPN